MTKKFDLPESWLESIQLWLDSNYPKKIPVFIARGHLGFSKDNFLVLVDNDLVLLKSKKNQFNTETKTMDNFIAVNVILGALQVTFKNSKNKEEYISIGIKDKSVLNEVKDLISSERKLKVVATSKEINNHSVTLNQIDKGTFIGTFTPETGRQLYERASTRWADRKISDLLKSGGRPINVYTKIIESENQVYPIDHQVTADVVIDGQIQVSRRPTLTRMGLLAPLPGTALIAGMALGKKESFDSREIHVTISHPNWSLLVRVSPKSLGKTKELANRINSIADSLIPKNLVQQNGGKEIDKVSKLREIKELLDSGFINQDEADKMKKELLN